MRQIGTIEGEERARRFSDLLTVEGVDHQVDADADAHGEYAVWVHDEDRLAEAGELLDRWRSDPALADSPGLTEKARALRKKQEKEREAARKRAERSRPRLRGRRGTAPLTIVLVLISVGVYMITKGGDDARAVRRLVFYGWQSEPWRLVTPIFIHFGILHIVFNLWWLLELGSAIERHHGLRVYLPLLLLTSIPPNFAQAYLPAMFFGRMSWFGGMSGVVYGLLGYIWIRGKFDPLSGLHLPPYIVNFMLIWFFLGVFGVIGGIANWAHGAGLVMGMAYGYFLARVFPSHRLR